MAAPPHLKPIRSAGVTTQSKRVTASDHALRITCHLTQHHREVVVGSGIRGLKLEGGAELDDCSIKLTQCSERLA
jgi:hypothetical protein